MSGFLTRIKKALQDPILGYYKLKFALGRRFPKTFSDKFFLEAAYYVHFHKRLNLKNPQTFNEKLQWLKLYNRRPEYTTMVDKYAAKEYVAGIIGEEHIIPTLGVWDSFDEIDFAALPDQFVLKPTHDSGSVVVCRDKSRLDKDKARELLTKSLNNDFYLQGREWPYKNVPRRIIAEKFLIEAGGLTDYKFTCFDGEVDNVMGCYERSSGVTKFYFFDKDWNLLRLNRRGKQAPEGFTMPKPKNVERMFEIASVLSKGLPYVRVDMYNIDGHIYFGELTFFPDCGYDTNLLPETDSLFGGKIKLNKVDLK